jgi:hypothetical protein
MWNGTSWSSASTQAFSSDTYNHISCPTTGFCLAGAPDGGALVWNGSSWSSGTEIRWPDPNDGITNVSCGSTTTCLAPDEDGDIRVWNGTSWSIEHQVVPGPLKTSEGASAVSCGSPTFCMAVNNFGSAITWDGTALSPPVDIDGTQHLVAVSCPSANFCMALDSQFGWLEWNGAAWSTPKPIAVVHTAPNNGAPPPKPRNGRVPPPTTVLNGHVPGPCVSSCTTLANTYFNWVSCPTASFCVAVGSNGNASEWHGTSWTAVRSIDPNMAEKGRPLIDVDAVSCPTVSFCVAVFPDGDAVIGRSAA